MDLKLNALKRDTTIKPDAVRKGGAIPAILYGGRTKVATPLSIERREFQRLHAAAGESSLIKLTIGEKDMRNVLIYAVGRDPRSSEVQHIDFYEVRMDEKVHTKVQLVFLGEAPAVKNEGGNLVKTMHEVEVECLPADLPHELTISVGGLASFSDVLRVRDIPLPKGVEIKADADEIVALIEEPRAEEVPVEAPADDAAKIQAIKTEGEEKRSKKAAEEDKKEA